ncbi:type VII secretion-associated serine protease mycosin [Allostreptomyces psammosilenae]|uniref:Type VII secretion-associated serine protease mycosin n=1 Tax=Allostreptomyces psammosilenae TaxID=1892865 RepID=A0A852ZV34_9ACTN|nr:type VII secretion-associated serine protease mycosin [Allostreptomyces psammosilenae]NYI06253.1 type VII secretion-associated serine protease mycosin [Allostreptomyces psammosilenae]
MITWGRRLTLGAAATVLFVGSVAAPASADEVRDQQWALQNYQAEEVVWEQSTGEGVLVAVIDSGVDTSHPDLAGRVLPGFDLFESSDGDVDVDGHGTGMASLIAGTGHGEGGRDGVRGLAPDAQILPIRVIDRQYTAEGVSVAEAINLAVDQDADVINLSLDGIQYDDIEAAIQRAIAEDVVVVVGAGNTGDRILDRSLAATPGVLTVGAVDSQGRIWDRSNYGPYVSLSAPGVDIVSAGLDGGYRTGTGTSDATAYVSAAAALVISKFPELSAGQVINRLLESAMPPPDGTPVPSEYYGRGILNPNQALTADIPPGPEENPLVEAMGGDPAAVGPGAESAGTAAEEESGTPLGVWIGVGVGVLAVVVVVVGIVVARGRGSRGGPPGGGAGGGRGGAPVPGPAAPPIGSPQPNGWHHPPQQPYPGGQQYPPPRSYQPAPPSSAGPYGQNGYPPGGQRQGPFVQPPPPAPPQQ